MVRNIVGSLAEVGSGKRPQTWLKDVLEARDRTQAGMAAPPGGLYFSGVSYPPRYGLQGFGHQAVRHSFPERVEGRWLTL